MKGVSYPCTDNYSSRVNLGDEGAADTCPAAFRPHGIGFAQNHSDRRQNRHVEHGVELVRQIFGSLELQRHAAVAQIDYLGGFLAALGENRVGFRSSQRYALPLSLLAV